MCFHLFWLKKWNHWVKMIGICYLCERAKVIFKVVAPFYDSISHVWLLCILTSLVLSLFLILAALVQCSLITAVRLHFPDD